MKINPTLRSAALKAVRDVNIGITAVQYDTSGNRTEIVSLDEVNRLMNSYEFKRGYAEAINKVRGIIEFVFDPATSIKDLRRYVGIFNPDTLVPPLVVEPSAKKPPVATNTWKSIAGILAQHIDDNLDIKAAPESVRAALYTVYGFCRPQTRTATLNLDAAIKQPPSNGKDYTFVVERQYSGDWWTKSREIKAENEEAAVRVAFGGSAEPPKFWRVRLKKEGEQ